MSRPKVAKTGPNPLAGWLQRRWYSDSAPAALKPLSAVFGKAADYRRLQYEEGAKHAEKLSVPVIVVGNISVGGTGKTPLVVAIVKWLAEQGWQPGVVSRGYGGKAPKYPHTVQSATDTFAAGDEACLIQQLTGVQVVVDPQRSAAGKALIAAGCNVIVADDGLQHYAMARDIEIAVVDGERGLGNGQLLPAGPLREPPERLATVDFVVVNGELENSLGDDLKLWPMTFEQSAPEGNNGESSWRNWQDKTVHAVAGIGNPQRFFTQLEARGIKLIEHAFADHYDYQPADLDFGDGLPVLMTSKDAVKCRDFWQANYYQVPIAARLPDEFFAELRSKLVAAV